jgi:hypothetical protein
VPNDPGLLCYVCLGRVECALHATPFGGYDGSLDDDPESGAAHFDAPLDGAVGHVGQASGAAAALRSDAVGAAGGGLLAWVVAAVSAQATCLTVRPVSALWDEEVLRWNDDNHGLTPVSYMAELEVVTDDGECRVCSPFITAQGRHNAINHARSTCSFASVKLVSAPSSAGTSRYMVVELLPFMGSDMADLRCLASDVATWVNKRVRYPFPAHVLAPLCTLAHQSRF